MNKNSKGMKIAHEAPKSIFNLVQSSTDYDYFLVHLFEEDEEYLTLARNSVSLGREVILDNSIFELGEAFDAERFQHWVNDLKPTWYIVPDKLEDCDGTIKNMESWIKNRKPSIDPECKMIGVVQGKTYEDIVKCYRFMDKEANVDKIGISFDYSYYRESFKHPNKYVSWMMGRIKLLGDLLNDGVINTSKPHHLLGCSLPQEFRYYNYKWIESLDTSNPVVHGMQGIRYRSDGLLSKESVKLYTLINSQLDLNQKIDILHNIGIFKSFVADSTHEAIL